jgi:predicted metal-dependent hydrolase
MPVTAPMTTPADLTVTPRNIRFDTSSAKGAAWMGGDPVATAVFNALSLTFPDGERLFMDAVRHYKGELTGKLAEDAQAFIAQEAIHTREHVGLNAGLDRAHYPIDAIETEMRGRLAFLRSRGPMAMLGVTIALEHFTAMMADLFLDNPDLWANTPDDIVRLWQWHAMEETEHKAVAFDVFLAATKDWTPKQRFALRRRVMLLSTFFFTRNITQYASKLLVADGENPVVARVKVLNYLFGRPGLFRKSWRAYGDWFRPDFHPWNHDNRGKLEHWRGMFTAQAAA